MVILLIFLSTAIASDTDQEYKDKLIGVWSFDFSDGEISVSATEEFKNNGMLHSYGKVFHGDKLFEEYQIKSRWEVVDGYSNVEVIESSSTVLKPGTKITDKIISVDGKEFTFLAEDGMQTTLYRIK